MRKKVSKSVNVLSTLEKLFVRIDELLVLAGGVLIFLFMLTVIVDVSGRYLFAKPLPGTLEIGEAVLAFAIFLSLAYVLMRDQHIRVTVLLERVPIRWRAWFAILALVAGFFLMFLIAWQSLPFAIHSYQIKERGLCFPLPLFPAKFAYFAGSAILCIQFFIQCIKKLFAQLANKAPDNEENE